MSGRELSRSSLLLLPVLNLRVSSIIWRFVTSEGRLMILLTLFNCAPTFAAASGQDLAPCPRLTCSKPCVLSQLPDCLPPNAHSSRSLALTYQVKPIFLPSFRYSRRCHHSTDTFLESIAPLLSNLDHFHIAGCPELETRGVWALVSTNK